MTFHVGQKVVCVRSDWPDDAYTGFEVLPIKGEIYTVRNVLVLAGTPAIRLAEINNRPGLYETGRFECGFRRDHFRPLVERKKQTDISIFKKILDRLNDKAPVRALSLSNLPNNFSEGEY